LRVDQPSCTLYSSNTDEGGRGGPTPAGYRAEDNAAFQPRSRRPRTSLIATDAATTQLVLRLREQLCESGFDAGADLLGWNLTHHHQTTCRGHASVKHPSGGVVLHREALLQPEARSEAL
jgi:hypothetical protein